MTEQTPDTLEALPGDEEPPSGRYGWIVVGPWAYRLDNLIRHSEYGALLVVNGLTLEASEPVQAQQRTWVGSLSLLADEESICVRIVLGNDDGERKRFFGSTRSEADGWFEVVAGEESGPWCVHLVGNLLFAAIRKRIEQLEWKSSLPPDYDLARIQVAPKTPTLYGLARIYGAENVRWMILTPAERWRGDRTVSEAFLGMCEWPEHGDVPRG